VAVATVAGIEVKVMPVDNIPVAVTITVGVADNAAAALPVVISAVAVATQIEVAKNAAAATVEKKSASSITSDCWVSNATFPPRIRFDRSAFGKLTLMDYA
jgi:hypothetical protein